MKRNMIIKNLAVLFLGFIVGHFVHSIIYRVICVVLFGLIYGGILFAKDRKVRNVN